MIKITALRRRIAEGSSKDHRRIVEGRVCFESVSLLAKVFVAGAVPPDDEADEDEGHWGHDHQAVVLIAHLVEAELLRHGIAPEGAAAEEFAHEAENDENDTVAKSVAEAVEEARPRLLHHGESLEASHDDAVGDDEAHEDGELLADVVHVGFQHLVDQHHEGGDDDELHDDADARRDGVAHERDDEVAQGDDDGHRDGHHHGGLELRRHGQAGTDAQHLHEDGVVLAEGEFYQVKVFHSVASFLSSGISGDSGLSG